MLHSGYKTIIHCIASLVSVETTKLSSKQLMTVGRIVNSTPDGVAFADKNVNVIEINSEVFDLW